MPTANVANAAAVLLAEQQLLSRLASAAQLDRGAMEETEANDANFTELGRHIERLGVRLRKMDRGSAAYEQGIEDVEDYYERTIQLRQYTIDALKLEMTDAQLKYAAMKRTLGLIIAVLIFIVLGRMYISGN